MANGQISQEIRRREARYKEGTEHVEFSNH